jgi:hypothetical protein
MNIKGDSGAFGSKSMMNKIGKLQAKKPAFKGLSSPINPKYTAKNIRTRLSNLANKTFFN